MTWITLNTCAADMGIENILPIHSHHRSPSKIPITFNRLWRSKERLLVALMCFGLVIGCFGTVFFLPELRTGIALPSLNSVYKQVYKQVQKVGPEFILPLPPLAKDDAEAKLQQHHGQIDKPDFHLLEDQARLKAKIEREEQSEQEKNQQRVIPRPLIPQELANDVTSSTRYLFLSNTSMN